MISEQGIKEIMTTFLKVAVEDLQDETILTDLGVESFVLIEMLISLQDQLNVIINQEDLQYVTTVGDLVGVFIAKGAQ